MATEDVCVTASALAPTLLALQFAAFGWRIVREIDVGDKDRRAWLPLTDYLNLASMAAVVLIYVILPLGGIQNFLLISAVLSVASVVLAMHPINVAAHYRLFSRKGRTIYTPDNGYADIPLTTDQEWITLGLTVLLAIVAAMWIVSG